jgi:glucose/arabinose dehydrogenase
MRATLGVLLGAMVPALAFGEILTETVATGLENPWSLAFAPDGRLFVGERPGRIRVIDAQGQLKAGTVVDKKQLGTNLGELCGIAVDPNFSQNHFLYVFHTYPEQPSDRIVRLVEQNDTALLDREILTLPSGSCGGRIKFGPDGFLYATTASGGSGPGPGSDDAQKLDNLRGKILRVTPDGAPAPGNPLAQSPIYAYGFRNPLGIAFDSSGQLYATDQGPILNDKLHIVRAGHNYGWPSCTGACDPAIRLFFPTSVSAASMTFYQGTALPGWDNSLLVGVLGLPAKPIGQHIHRLLLDRPGGTAIKEEELLFQGFDRILDVAEGPNEFLYFSTSNREENGTYVLGPDDRIMRIRIADTQDGGVDGGPPDAGSDAGPPDAGSDAGPPDAGSDAGPPDAGSDAGPPDAGTDAGPPDAGSDAGPPGVDGGTPDDGGTDAGPPDDGGAGGSAPDGGSGSGPPGVDSGSPSAQDPNNPIRVNTTGCGCAASGLGAMYFVLLLGLTLLRGARPRR